MNFKTNAFAYRATRVAHLARWAGMLAMAALALMPQTMRAQNLILDNFATGAGKVAALTGIKTVTQTGTGIIGESRYIILNTFVNPYMQPVQVQVRPSGNASDPSSLLSSVGFAASAEIYVVYGQTTPLNLNLTGYDRLRINFGGLSSALNLNLEAEQGSGIAAQCALNLGPSGESNSVPVPFTVDFPLSAFGANGGGPVDWSDILAFEIILGGGPDLAITKFLAIPNGSTEAPATFTCAPPAA